MFVLLALVFAVGFVVFGVGSGSTGISSALQNAFNFGGNGGGPSISSLQHKTAKNPQDAGAWRNLATAYEEKHRTGDAITALVRYTKLRPKDQSALQELASQYTALADNYSSQAQVIEATAQSADPFSTIAPPSSTALGKAFASTTELQDPITAAVSQQSTSQATTLFGKLNDAALKAEDAYKRLAKLAPNDASNQIQLGQAAQAASDTKTAVAAFRRFLKLAPGDPLAPQVRAQLKQLAPAKK
jgi:tetratricopeptide (TPR) repeat protein